MSDVTRFGLALVSVALAIIGVVLGLVGAWIMRRRRR
jgi:predicted benzoate:H+ symporter BenE